MGNQVFVVQICQQDASMDVTCTNLAGEVQCTLNLASDDTIAALQSALRRKLQWADADPIVWDGAEKVTDADQVSKYTSLTVKKSIINDQVNGCYECNQHGVGPAGYSASGSTSVYTLVLEQGRAGLQHRFKGDYKRAEELRELVMLDARWSIEVGNDGAQFVRIVGKAVLNRFWVHERSGPSGLSLSNFRCHALVKIPVEQLLQAQTSERFTHTSTEGSGWSCGSENYSGAWFLPACVLNGVREYDDPNWIVGNALTQGARQEYPYNKMASCGRGRYGGAAMIRLDSKQFSQIKYLRQQLMSRAEVSLVELLELQAAASIADQEKMG